MKRFWISWEQPGDDYRAVLWPLSNDLEYWCSGYTSDDKATICALVEAPTLTAAKKILREHWPEFPIATKRFENEVAPDFIPGDRFPLKHPSRWKTPASRRPAKRRARR